VGWCRQAPGGPHQPPVYMDLASLGALPRYTCGQLYYYPAFNARRDQVNSNCHLQAATLIPCMHDCRQSCAHAAPWGCSSAPFTSQLTGDFTMRLRISACTVCVLSGEAGAYREAQSVTVDRV
jgi:hypothetical protein